jgi:hypothetical protein
MAVYLWENVHLVPGMTSEYARAYAERWLPLSDKYDRDFLRVTGFFLPNVLNATNPTVNILWTVDSWESWGNAATRGTPEEHLAKTHDFYMPALSWRTGWTDKMIESLSFSPIPPSRPDSVQPGATVIVHRFALEPKSCGAFVDAFKEDVMPAAPGVGLTLQLFARAIGHPTEYFAFWTIAPGADYASWRNGRDPDLAHSLLPGFERTWSMLLDVEEHELSPTWYSPIGGTQRNPRQLTESEFAI